MKILAFAATSSRQSINKQLVNFTAKQVPNADVELIDLNDYEMPIYSSDREAESGIPEAAQRFFNKISEADAVIVSFAEHNGTYTAAYKNVFDWASRINQKVFQNKKMLLLSTSPGPGGAKSVLAQAVASSPFFAADVKGSLSVPSFYENFDVTSGEFKNAEVLDALLTQVAALSR
jgi:chromate reductase